jgi:hypothetical protein
VVGHRELLHCDAGGGLHAQPTEVTEGEPVTVTATGSNFNPKHSVATPGRPMAASWIRATQQSARIDTTGVAAGSYSANATISDAKMKKGGSATCAASFTVKAKPMNPPQVSCSANPSTVQSGSAVHHNGFGEQPGQRADHWLLVHRERWPDQRHRHDGHSGHGWLRWPR